MMTTGNDDLEAYVSQAIDAASAEILRFLKQSLTRMETRTRAALNFQVLLCKEQIKELDGRLNEFRKEMLLKEEETKQGCCMEGILELLQDLHTVVSKMISKNKGSHTYSHSQKQIHDEASQSCSESQKEQDFLKNNHEETLFTSPLTNQFHVNAFHEGQSTQNKFHEKIPAQSYGRSLRSELNMTTIPAIPSSTDRGDASPVKQNDSLCCKGFSSAVHAYEENGLGADNECFTTKSVKESETLALDKADSVMHHSGVIEHGTDEGLEVEDVLFEGSENTKEEMMFTSRSFKKMSGYRQTQSFTSAHPMPDVKGTKTRCDQPDVCRKCLSGADNGVTCERKDAACWGRGETQAKSHGAINDKAIGNRLNCSNFKRVRKCRRFSSAQIECLVKAVEKFGTGRWRDVKENYFSLEKDLSAGDLKDKWRSLVHSAHLAPQDRRCLKLTSPLANRILDVHMKF